MASLRSIGISVALAAPLGACDSAEPDAGPGALLTVQATTAAGAPAAGLDLFATYGALQPASRRATSASGAVDVSAPSPSPAVRVSSVTFQTSTDGPVRVRLLDIARQAVAVVLDDVLEAGAHRVLVDLEGVLAGVYRVVVEAGGESAERYLLKTDGAGDPVPLGLAIYLGRTGADGRVVVNDSTRFPALYDVPRRFVTIDDQGSQLGEFEVGRAIGLVLQNADGDSDGRVVTLRDGGTAVDLTFDP